jgi:hemoglobin/transferrin/lactoferrin receptor protein
MVSYIRLLVLLLLSTVLAQSIDAQQVVVVDENTGDAVDHVALYNQDMSVSTLTDKFGKADVGEFGTGDSIYFQHHSYELTAFLKHELVYGNGRVVLNKRNIMMEEFVISAVKGIEKKGESPYMIDILEPEQLNTTGFQTGADILRSTGNIMVQKSQGGGGSPILRGFEANKILLVVDGVRMNNAIYRSGHLQNAITIDNNILDRVEVLFGPSSIIYGSDALGGVVHYYTRNPKFERKNLRFYTQYSSANQGKIVHADFNIGGKKIANMTSITFRDFGNVRSGKNRPASIGDWGLHMHSVDQVNEMDSTHANPSPHIQMNSGYTQTDIVSKTRYAPSGNIDLILNLQLSTSSAIDRFDQLNDYNGDNLKYAEWYYGPQNRFMASMQGLYKNYNKFYTNATSTLAFQKIKEDRITRLFRVDDKLFQEEDVYVYSGNFDFTKVLNQGQRLYYGLEITHNDVRSDARYENIRTGAVQNALTRYPGGGSHTNTFAAYGNYKLIPSQKMVVNVGLRYQYGTLNSKFTDANLPFDEISIDNGAMTGSASLVYRPSPGWQYNFILATGFRNPNVDDYGKVRAKGDYVTVPNKDLKSEYTYNTELGISKNIPGFATISGSIYFTYLTNAIVRTDHLLNGSDTLLYDGLYYKVITNSNASLATIQGISLNAYSDLPGKFAFMGTFNYLKGTDITNNVPLGHIPPFFGKVSLSHVFKLGNSGRAGSETNNQPGLSPTSSENPVFRGILTNEIFIHYSGRKYWSDMTPYGEDNEEEAIFGEGFPAWYTLNFRSHYRINEQFEIQFSIENIFDRFYKTFASGIGAPGRNFIFSLRISI